MRSDWEHAWIKKKKKNFVHFCVESLFERFSLWNFIQFRICVARSDPSIFLFSMFLFDVESVDGMTRARARLYVYVVFFFVLSSFIPSSMNCKRIPKLLSFDWIWKVLIAWYGHTTNGKQMLRKALEHRFKGDYKLFERLSATNGKNC